jgi:hypothetical protein
MLLAASSIDQSGIDLLGRRYQDRVLKNSPCNLAEIHRPRYLQRFSRTGGHFLPPDSSKWKVLHWKSVNPFAGTDRFYPQLVWRGLRAVVSQVLK